MRRVMSASGTQHVTHLPLCSPTFFFFLRYFREIFKTSFDAPVAKLIAPVRTGLIGNCARSGFTIYTLNRMRENMRDHYLRSFI